VYPGGRVRKHRPFATPPAGYPASMTADREPDADLAQVRQHIKEAKEAAEKAELTDPPEAAPEPDPPHQEKSSPSDA
jgi:hypothetical protein